MLVENRAGFGVLLGAFLALGAPAAAQHDAIGEIAATIDGEAFEWRTHGPDGSGNDYNTSVSSQFGVLDVSVMGFPPGAITMRGVAQLTFMMMPGSLDMIEQQVIFAPEGMNRMWISMDGEDLIEIEHFDPAAPTGSVSGRFAGRVCQKASLFAEPDPDTCKEVEGTFSTALPHSGN